MILGNPQESGVDLAVALLNTWDTYDDPPEHLAAEADLRLFLRLVGRRRAARVAGATELTAVKDVRDRLRRVFETADEDEAARVLNAVAAEAGALPRLERARGDWVVRYGPDESDVVGHLAATAAGSLLEVVRAHGLSRFGTCAAAPCTGVFVDRTKNRRKRYCCELCADRSAQRDHRARLGRSGRS
jgi:predicted RNA-binding Zn ribbon-like protein